MQHPPVLHVDILFPNAAMIFAQEEGSQTRVCDGYKCWHRLLREVVVTPSLEILKITALGNLL